MEEVQYTVDPSRINTVPTIGIYIRAFNASLKAYGSYDLNELNDQSLEAWLFRDWRATVRTVFMLLGRNK